MKQHPLFSIAILLLVATSAAGCGRELAPGIAGVQPTAAPAQTEDRGGIGEKAPTGTAVPTAMPTREEATMTPTPARKATEVELQEGTERVVQLAREDLAQRLDMAPDAIRLVSIEAVEWRDASLGCPQPGMVYAQVITPGFRVVLEAEGERHIYHTDEQQKVVYCEPREAPALLRSVSSESVKLAKEDLARRLGIPADSIDVVAAVGQEFPADAFYCRTRKERIARDESPAVIVGETILLRAAGRRYEYHASGQTVVFCRQLR